jgi:hypothetical protein
VACGHHKPLGQRSFAAQRFLLCISLSAPADGTQSGNFKITIDLAQRNFTAEEYAAVMPSRFVHLSPSIKKLIIRVFQQREVGETPLEFNVVHVSILALLDKFTKIPAGTNFGDIKFHSLS